MVSLAARNSMDEYTDNHHYRRFLEAIPMQFNEANVLLDPYHNLCRFPAEYRRTSLFSIV